MKFTGSDWCATVACAELLWRPVVTLVVVYDRP